MLAPELHEESTMARQRLKRNKGFYPLLLGETFYSAIQTGASLALVNLPMALVATALDFSANIIGGFMLGPRGARAIQNTAPAPAEKSPLQGKKNFAKKFITYNVSCFKDPDFTVGSSAASAGVTFFFQGALGLKSLLATHAITILPGLLTLTGVSLPVGIGITAAMATLGLVSIVAGNIEKWRGLNKYYHRIFGNGAPAGTPERKGFVRNFFERPVMKKICDNKVSKVLKKALLAGMTIESGLYAISASASAIIRGGAAVMASPGKILANVAPVGWAAIWGGRATWQLISAGRVSLRNMFHRKPETASTLATVTRPVATQPAIHAAMPETPLANTFEKVADKAPVQNTNDNISASAVTTASQKKPHIVPKK